MARLKKKTKTMKNKLKLKSSQFTDYDKIALNFEGC